MVIGQRDELQDRYEWIIYRVITASRPKTKETPFGFSVVRIRKVKS